MNKEKVQKIIQILLNVICILILILPYSTTYLVVYEESQGEWINSFVLVNLELTIFILPLIVLIFLFQIIKNQTFKELLSIFASIISGIYFLYTILSLLMPIPDFMPSYGMGLIILLFPVLLIHVIWTAKKRKSIVQQTLN